MTQKTRDEERPEDLPPEAVERIQREQRAAVWGYGLMAAGAVTICVPTILNGTIGAVPALSGIAVALLGGLVRDPKTFKGIVERAIDALPGGKH